VERKGFKYLIQAMKILPKEIELSLIGDGPLEENLKSLTKKLKVNSRVHFLGFVSEEKKFQYLASSDLYVLPSLHEGFGIVLQEAMQVGLPIVATNNGGQVDILENGKNALLISPKNSTKLARVILEIYQNKKTAKSFSKNNLSRSKSFALKKIAYRYKNFI